MVTKIRRDVGKFLARDIRQASGDEKCCDAESESFICTRVKGHRGVHAAHTTNTTRANVGSEEAQFVVAIWENWG